MSSRDRILGRIRGALADVDPDRSADTAPRDYRSQAFDDVVGRFCEVVADYQATVHRTDDPAGVIATILAAEGAVRLVIPSDLDVDLVSRVDAAVEVVRDGGDGAVLSSRDLDTMHAVVTTARVGIAATGTIVLDHGRGQGRRALTLVPDLHVCVVDEAQVVADVPDAVAQLDPRRPQTWISGPSATSDIELSRVEGVHGPRRLHVIVHQPSP